MLVLPFTKSITKGVTEIKQAVHMGQAILTIAWFVLPFFSAHVTVEIHLLCLFFHVADSDTGLEGSILHKLQHYEYCISDVLQD